MSYIFRSLLVGAAAALIHTVTEPAQALSCAEPGVLAPARDATDVPTNTLVWCSRANVGDTFQITVLDPQGKPVAGTASLITSPLFRTTVFRPSEELAPNTQYTVSCRSYAEPSTFTTGAGPRNQTPAVPDLTNMTIRASEGGWGHTLGAVLSDPSPEGTLVALDLERSARLDAGDLSGSISDLTLMGASPSMVWVASAPCVFSWPEAKLGASTHFRLAAFDLTGAFSGWTESIELSVPEQYEENAEPPPEPTVPDAGELLSDNPEPVVTTPTGSSDDIPSANDEAFARGSDGCQLGAPGDTWMSAGLLVALAGIVARRRRRA